MKLKEHATSPENEMREKEILTTIIYDTYHVLSSPILIHGISDLLHILLSALVGKQAERDH